MRLSRNGGKYRVLINMKTILIIDFDSTFITGESLEMLAEIAMKDFPSEKRQEILTKMTQITNDGMSGKIDLRTSLRNRLKLFQPNKKHIRLLTQLLEQTVTPSFKKNKKFIEDNSERIYFVSGGFIDYMIPLLISFGIKEDHIFGNSFNYLNDEIVGFDEKNPLVESDGKGKIVESLKLAERSVVIGDGYTDYLVYKNGFAADFLLFTENVRRATLVDISKIEVKSFDEVLNFIGD